MTFAKLGRCKLLQIKVQVLVTESDRGAKRWNLWENAESEEKDVVMIDSEDEILHSVQPLRQRKTKTQQQQPQPAGQPPIQETCRMREHTLTELFDIAAKFEHKARVSVAMGYRGHGISLTGREAEKMSNITTHTLPSGSTCMAFRGFRCSLL